MDNAVLNLARAWRSKTFDEIIGQDLAVRLVKNSLFKQQLFPVYLLAGQRGCGKTTLGRVFSAAINCAQREAFCKNPREVTLPCLQCPSCTAMRDGAHPDFNEVDAASHTGVDNVRGLIEGASFLPILGSTKIYLIDEAHMLSKAAFNAFLKILEEPPTGVVFMLATTDPHKIIDTVRSRCFQLFLNPVATPVLHQHLVRICQAEGLAYEEEALLAMVTESEGSVRDALNHLERVRLGYEAITLTAVRSVLGSVGYDVIFALCQAAFTASPEEVMASLAQAPIGQSASAHVWKKIAEVLRSLIDAYMGVVSPGFEIYQERLEALARQLTWEQLIGALELWYQTEPLFSKTQLPVTLLEVALLKINHQFSCKRPVSPISKPVERQRQEQPQAQASVRPQPRPPEVKVSAGVSDAKLPADIGLWNTLIESLKAKQDPLVLSVFSQGRFVEYREQRIVVQFGQHLIFFKDLLEQTKAVWQPLVSASFGAEARLAAEFTDTVASASQTVKVNGEGVAKSLPERATLPVERAHEAAQQQASRQSAAPTDIKDNERWKKVNMLLRTFPGTVTEERE